jgi:hypothetical protein
MERIFQVDKKYGNGALDTDIDAAYSKKREPGNNENKNKVKKISYTRSTYKSNRVQFRTRMAQVGVIHNTVS